MKVETRIETERVWNDSGALILQMCRNLDAKSFAFYMVQFRDRLPTKIMFQASKSYYTIKVIKSNNRVPIIIQ